MSSDVVLLESCVAVYEAFVLVKAGADIRVYFQFISCFIKKQFVLG